MKFKDIPQYTSEGKYQINVSLSYLQAQFESYENDFGLVLNPDFQRGHIWTEEQQISFVEHILKGGRSSLTIYFNCVGFEDLDTSDSPMVCMDGLQRLTAVNKFLNNEIKVFGHYINQFEDSVTRRFFLIFNVNSLRTRKEMLQWYVDYNSGGTVHSKDELCRVQKLIDLEESN